MPFADKLKKLIKPRAFLLKLFLTTLVFICIPLLCLQIFVVGQSTDEFRKNNQEYYVSTLQASANTFASKEQVLSQTALRISLNEDVQKPLRHNATEYSLYEAAEAISGYGAEILHVEGVGVYYASKGYLLTNGYKYNLRDYCEKVEPTEPEKAQKMETFFEELKSIGYYATSDGRVLYMARPIALGSAGRFDAIAFFAMDAKSLEESYRASVSLPSSFAILDDQGAFLIKGTDFTENISSGALSDIVSSGSSVFTAGEEENLLVYKYTEPETDFAFLLCVDKDESQEQLLNFAQLVRTTMLAMLILVGISLAVTIYINYLPIHRLLKKHTTSEANHEMHSEIERLDSAFFKLDEKTSSQRDLLMDFILGDLLYGNAVKPELVNQYFPAGRYRFFAVMTALYPSLTVVQSRQLANRIMESTGHTIFVTSVPNRPHAVIICLSESDLNPLALHNCVDKAIEDVLEQKCPLCMGEVVQDIYKLRASYRSAITAGWDPVQAQPGSNADEFAKMLQVLSQCVYVGDEGEALHHLEKIKSFLYTKTVGEGHLRYYGFKLLQSYLSSVNASKTQLSGQEAELLLSFSSMEHLFKLLSESIHQICGQMADTERTSDLQLQQRLLQYVDTHFIHSELCLTAAADHIGTSIYAVSRLFKEITGKGFKDYVTEKRLEHGHMLLCTTQKSIADISAESGFENANYFSTLFKQKYGMPPTKYRNHQKEKQSV